MKKYVICKKSGKFSTLLYFNGHIFDEHNDAHSQWVKKLSDVNDAFIFESLKDLVSWVSDLYVGESIKCVNV